MRCKTYREQGLFWGAGVVEGGCRSVIGQRLKEWSRACTNCATGQETKLLREIAHLKASADAAGETVAREQGYFATHAGRMNYAEVARRGWPIGSGAVESACRQKQGRFKRPGQFWTPTGLRHLMALDEARRNGHWLELWQN